MFVPAGMVQGFRNAGDRPARRWVVGPVEVAEELRAGERPREKWAEVHERHRSHDARSYLSDGLTSPEFRITFRHMKSGGSKRQYRQVARAEGRQRTREALLDAAEHEFFAGQFENVSLEDLAARAGVTKQTLLRHFSTKEGLLEASALRGRDRIAAQRFSAAPGDIAAAVDTLLEHYEQDGERSLAIGALEGRDGVLGDLVAHAKRLHYDWVEHAFAPQLARLRGRARARRRAALIALCDVHVWRLLAHDLRLPRAEVRRTVIESIERLLEDGDGAR
ncbi:MAG: TetR/AcrR family transcriptional regulator [Solirubrobacterales bacterium]|nr:TetR/AcrR family transcriptional regulator [Solirubrobacterales bacterium]